MSDDNSLALSKEYHRRGVKLARAESLALIHCMTGQTGAFVQVYSKWVWGTGATRSS